MQYSICAVVENMLKMLLHVIFSAMNFFMHIFNMPVLYLQC